MAGLNNQVSHFFDK